MKKNDMHILVWQAMPTIQCAYPFLHLYLNEMNKINNQFLNDVGSFALNRVRPLKDHFNCS